VMAVCRRLGVPLPEYRTLALDAITGDAVNRFRPWFIETTGHPAPGDLVLIRKMDGSEYHVGVMVERGWFLQATSDHGVFRMRLNHPRVRDRIEGIYRYKGQEREKRIEKREDQALGIPG